MIDNFKINTKDIRNLKFLSKKEKEFRNKNLNLFNEKGFPNKQDEDWKFSDLRKIINNNFKNLSTKVSKNIPKKINFIKDFEHNYLIIVDGELNSSNFKHENKKKISIKTYKNKIFSENNKDNSLINLNHALSNRGFDLEVKNNYKLNKILIIYNIFTKNLKNIIINSKNNIKIGKNSELHSIDYVINESKNKFINNIYENVNLESDAIYKNICIQNKKSEGYFHKFSKNQLASKSKFTSFIFLSGLKFNKLDLVFDLKGKNSECNLQSASFLDRDDHQEIKTKINHLAPNCKSYQKVKNVLESDGKGVFQGKIYVKDIAQKTDAYQLSKAMMLSDNSEFDSKPELEIYADDVKCSHGSTSGQVDQNSIFYLMSRGLSKVEATRMLVNAFLSEIAETIKSKPIRNFIKSKINRQIHGY